MFREYVALVHKEEGSDYGVSFLDFPGCVTGGDTPEEAHAMALEALQFHVDGMVEEKLEIPEPTSLNDAPAHVATEGALIARER